MRRRIVVGLAVGAAIMMWSGASLSQGTVATPAIDSSIFKEGAIEDKNFQFEAWYAKCRQIIKIKKRVCNLITQLFDEAGSVAGSVIIASTDTGIPAMMISVPGALTQRRPVTIDAHIHSKVDGKTIKVEFSNTVEPMICDVSCKYMFPLDSKLVFILNAGESGFVTAAVPDDAKKGAVKSTPKTLSPKFRISGKGFAQALAESTREW